MKEKRHLLLLIAILWTQWSYAQDIFKWQRMVIPTVPQNITIQNGKLVARTVDETFYSDDMGETWTPSLFHHLDASYWGVKDSICVYRTPPKSVAFIDPDLYLVGRYLYTMVAPYGISIPGYQGAKNGATEYVHTADVKIFNDNTILAYISGERIVYSDNSEPTTIDLSSDLIIHTNGLVDTSHFSNFYPTGHLNGYYVAIGLDSLKFMPDTGSVVTLTKPLPNVGIPTWEAMIDSSIFLLNTDGRTWVTHNLGDSWTADSLTISNILSYKTRGNLHIIRTQQGYYLSKNFKDFVPFPILDSTDLGYKKFYAFGDLALAVGNNKNHFYRSLDGGLNWEILENTGISANKTARIFTFMDTLYAIDNHGLLYQKQCNGTFLPSQQTFLTEPNVYFDNHVAFKLENNILSKFNLDTHQWEVVNSNFSDQYLKGVKTDGQRIYLYGQLLSVSEDDGATWTNLSIPYNGLIKKFYAKDSALFVTIDHQNYYSNDYGQSFTHIDDGDFYILNNKLHLMKGTKLYKYDLPTGNPVDSFEIKQNYFLPFGKYFFEQAGDNLFCIYKSEHLDFGLEDLPFQIYLFRDGYHTWHDVSDVFPKEWNEEFFNHWYFNTYAWKRGFRQVVYNEREKSLYFVTKHSGIQRTSTALLDTAGVNYQIGGEYCVGDSDFPTSQAGNYGQLVYHPCEPDSLYFVNTYYAHDTTINYCLEPGATFEYRNHQFSEPGSFYVNLTANGDCDTLGHFIIYEKKDSIFAEVDEHICSGDSILIHGKYYTSPGFYYDTISAQLCSHLIGTIKLDTNIINTYATPNKTFFVCNGSQFYYNGKYYTSPGIYYDTLAQNTPCSWKLRKIELTDQPSEEVQEISFDCEPSDSILFEGNYYAAPGVYYIDTLLSVNGCDSIIRVLQVHSELLVDYQTNELHCPGDTVQWGHLVITSTGFYTDTLQNGCGYDSVIVHKSFTFRPLIKKYDQSFLCEGDSLVGYQMVVTQPGLYPLDTIISLTTGCDSVIFYWNVTGLSSDSTFIESEIGDVVSGVLIQGDTTFIRTIVSEEFGCDSLHQIFVISTPVGTDDLLAQKILLYPNPANQTLHISNLPPNISSLAVRDELNRVVYRKTGKIEAEEIIQLGHLASGIYTLEVIDHQQRYYFRFTRISQ